MDMCAYMYTLITNTFTFKCLKPKTLFLVLEGKITSKSYFLLWDSVSFNSWKLRRSEYNFSKQGNLADQLKESSEI